MKKYKGHPKFHKILEELRELHNNKNYDYAGNKHPLGNFYRCGKITKELFKGENLEELKIALCYMSKQFDAVIDMIGNNRIGKAESIKDKFRDLAVYSIICMILLEEKNDTK